MKPIHTCAVTVSLLCSATAFADSWNTIDDYDNGGNGAYGTGVTVDENGDVFTVGYQIIPYVDQQGPTSRDQWLVRSNATGWATVDAYDYPGAQQSDFSSAASTMFCNGNLYVSGYAQLNGINHAIVRVSTDGGQTFNNVLDLSQGGASGSSAAGMACGPDGTRYVVVTDYDASNLFLLWGEGFQWHLYATSDDTTWNPIDTFTVEGATGNAVAINGTDVFVVGTKQSKQKGAKDGDLRWIVRRGTAQGTGWSTVDNGEADTLAGPATVAFFGPQTVFVGGTIDKAYLAERFRLLVRKGDLSTTPITWTVAAGLGGTPMTTDSASALLHIPGFGGMHSAGSVTHNNGNSYWTVRRSTSPGVGSWTVSDAFLPNGANFASANGLATLKGNKWAAGYAHVGNTYHMITRQH